MQEFGSCPFEEMEDDGDKDEDPEPDPVPRGDSPGKGASFVDEAVLAGLLSMAVHLSTRGTRGTPTGDAADEFVKARTPSKEGLPVGDISQILLVLLGGAALVAGGKRFGMARAPATIGLAERSLPLWVATLLGYGGKSIYQAPPPLPAPQMAQGFIEWMVNNMGLTQFDQKRKRISAVGKRSAAHQDPDVPGAGGGIPPAADFGEWHYWAFDAESGQFGPFRGPSWLDPNTLTLENFHWWMGGISDQSRGNVDDLGWHYSESPGYWNESDPGPFAPSSGSSSETTQSHATSP